MNATWYSGTLRWIASSMTRLADDLDNPPAPAEPLEPGPDLTPVEDRLFELRHRLSRYY
jgi:hypothetical protein